MPYRITFAKGRGTDPFVSIIDADGFVGRADRLTFQHAQLEWLEDPEVE